MDRVEKCSSFTIAFAEQRVKAHFIVLEFLQFKRKLEKMQIFILRPNLSTIDEDSPHILFLCFEFNI